MKKIIYILALATIPSLLTAQTEMKIGDFQKLSVYDGINVELIKSETNRVEITGKNTAYIVVKNNQILENITNKKTTENLKEIINERVGNIRESSGSFSYIRSKSYFDYHRKINSN